MTKIKIPSPVDILADPPTAETMNDLRTNVTARLSTIQRLHTAVLAGSAAAGLALFALTLHSGALIVGVADLQDGKAAAQAAMLAGLWATAAACLGHFAWRACYAFLAPDAWNERVLRKLVDDFQLVTPETHPDECLDLAYLCQADPIVGAYLQKLVGVQRHPTVAEFRAARAWFGDAAARKKVASARAACAEMGMAYGPTAA